MKQTINLYQFRDAFQRMDRGDQFSYEGLEALYNYLEEVNPEYDLDVIALCCDFSQCSLNEFLDSFDVELEDADLTKLDEAKKDAIAHFIEYNGYWFQFVEDGKEVIFQNF